MSRPATESSPRSVTEDDRPAIVDLYNHYVKDSHVTFDTEPFSVASRSPWFAQFDGRRHQCLVARDGDRLLGYACSTPLKPKPGYATSVEVSVYVAPGAGGRGVGSGLYETLLDRLAAHDVHRAYAIVALPNDASLALHARFGFKQVSHLNEVGRKFDRYWDVVWLERRF